MTSGNEASSAPSLSSAEVRDHYDQFAWVYRRYWGDHIHHGFFHTGREDSTQAQELMLRHCAARAGVRQGMKVADVGCGHGGTAAFLAGKYGCQVLGLTFSETQLHIARKSCERWNGAVQFVLADAEHYEFPAASFDLIWNMESSEHFFDKAGYFRKAAASLKPGGSLLLAAWSGSMRDQVIRDIARVFLCPQLWTTAQYVEAMEGAGLSVTFCEQLSTEVARTWDIAAEQARNSKWMLSIVPAPFREFAHGIDLMREGYASGQLTYSIVVASRNAG